jgi:hypothetical protein
MPGLSQLAWTVGRADPAYTLIDGSAEKKPVPRLGFKPYPSSGSADRSQRLDQAMISAQCTLPLSEEAN